MDTSKPKASLSKNPGGGFTVQFRHPLRASNDQKSTRKVRRGLGTDDPNRAEFLVGELNCLLTDEYWWSPAKREEAEKRFERIAVEAFYDGPSPALRDSWTLRDLVIALPADYAKVRLLGTTGAGKTTLLRQLTGIDPKSERFPSTSTGKTTACDIEIVLKNGQYEAVVTFLPKDFVRQLTEDCVIAAAWEHVGSGEFDKVAEQLLEHVEQRFRLNYILGAPHIVSVEEAVDLDDEPTQIELTNEDTLVSDEERLELDKVLRGHLSQITSVATMCWDHLKAAGEIPAERTRENWDKVQERFEDCLRDEDAFLDVVDSLLNEIEKRFKFLEAGHLSKAKDGWPESWSCKFPSDKRAEFIFLINTFTSNSFGRWGRLLTPLVDGIRVSGPFGPDWYTDKNRPRLVFIDGEGLGHTPGSTSSLPTNLTKRFDIMDVILLVDDATQPMQAAPSAVLQQLVQSGHESKLVICFTHFEDVGGPNMPDPKMKRSHVRASLDNVIAALGKQQGRYVEQALKAAVEGRIFFLGGINSKLSISKAATLAELNRLMMIMLKALEPKEPPAATPIYDDANLVLAIQAAAKDYQRCWRARLGYELSAEFGRESWQRIKALTRRLGELGEDQYLYLMPVGDLINYLSQHLNRFLSQPIEWRGADKSEVGRNAAIAAVSRKVYTRLHKLSTDRVFVSMVKNWQNAYRLGGQGSTFVRARVIKDIYDVAAPIPDEVPSETSTSFIREVRQVLRDSVTAGGGKLIGIDA